MKTIERKNTKNISVSLSLDNYLTIEKFKKRGRIGRSEIINKALKAYAKAELQEELKNAYLEDNDESMEFANNSLVIFNQSTGK